MICSHCGCSNESTGQGKPRSVPQHRRYFKMIHAAYVHWPEADLREHGLENEEDFRKFLQMKAGHREIGSRVELPDDMNKEHALFLAESAIRATGAYAVPVLHNSTLVVFRPRSIAFDKLSHLEACALFDSVALHIEQTLECPVDQLLKMQETAA